MDEERKELGKIDRFDVGIGGYQDAMLGIHITFTGGGGWGINTSMSTWSPSMIKITEHTKWTEVERSQHFDEIMRFIDETLSKAKVRYTHQLRGIPVEITFDDKETLKSWRVLTEVL